MNKQTNIGKQNLGARMDIDLTQILGVSVANVTVGGLHSLIENYISNHSRALILNVNAHCLNLAYSLKWLRDFLNSAELVFCDGAGVILGARILGYHISERITYADWAWQLAEFAEARAYSLFFLGAKSGVAEKAAIKLKMRFPGLRIVGTYHGYFSKAQHSLHNKQIIREISAKKPNILIVGFGMPLQERWLMENWGRLEVNIALTGGAVFDYVSGEVRRAPSWMTDNGLEWLGRLHIEPRRLWKRYLIGNPLFLWRVLKQRFGVLRLPE